MVMVATVLGWAAVDELGEVGAVEEGEGGDDMAAQR